MSTETDVSPDLSALWAAYRQCPSTDLREQLARSYMGLVHHVAWQIGRRMSALEPGDLAGAGSLGLLRAIDRFECERGLAFSTYAVRCIRGAILDDLRQRDSMPRGMRSRTRRIEAARSALAARLGRAPVPAEVATELGVPLERYWRWRDESGAVPWERSTAEDGSGPDDELERNFAAATPAAGDSALLEQEERQEVRRALAGLSPRLQQLLALLYYEEMPARQVAGILGVTESRVSQLRKQALEQMRRSLSATGVGP
ncbi:MAG TPA: sigma-70 family RNA polymerase sigma factor [Gemmatimonadales bacterium]|nr:sigma-70 family RNA polymerase sigma factor [Gemmatimonadales bacterium]